MDIRRITDTFSVSPQIAREDFAEVARLGFKTVICNRPDGESPGQLSAGEAEAAAKAAGLAFIYAPFQGQPTQEAVKAIEGLGAEPTFAYCRSGTRCTTAWALAQARLGKLSVDDIIGHAADAGYDLSPLKQALHGLSPKG